MKIIGVKSLTGEYQGHIYDNLQIFCTFDLEGKDGDFAGQGSMKFSIKKTKCFDLAEIAKKDMKKLIGLNIDVFFDQYNKPCRVDILS